MTICIAIVITGWRTYMTIEESRHKCHIPEMFDRQSGSLLLEAGPGAHMENLVAFGDDDAILNNFSLTTRQKPIGSNYKNHDDSDFLRDPNSRY
jgi:hypothetical protein